MIKVLHVLDHSLPVQSGYAFRSQAIVRAQLKQGMQPFVLTSPKHCESWNGAVERVEAIDGVRYYRANKIARSQLPFVGESKIMLVLLKAAFAIVRREKPDLLHAHSPILNAFPALFVGRLMRIPVVYEMRSSWEDAGVDQGTYTQGNWKYRLAQGLETRACLWANHVVALCNGLKQDLVSRGVPGHQITVVPNGVDTSAFTRQPSHELGDKFTEFKGKTVFGFFGSFFHWEGLDLLICAMAELVKKRSDIVLLLVGGGVEEASLRRLVREKGLEAQVLMPGRVPQREIPVLYSIADILVYPRHSMRLTELVTPLKPLEAMAMGKAVIASDVGGHRELIEHGRTGFLFKAGAVDSLVKLIERVLDDKPLRQMVAGLGEEWVRGERSWDKITQAYQRIYWAQLATSRTGR